MFEVKSLDIEQATGKSSSNMLRGCIIECNGNNIHNVVTILEHYGFTKFMGCSQHDWEQDFTCSSDEVAHIIVGFDGSFVPIDKELSFFYNLYDLIELAQKEDTSIRLVTYGDLSFMYDTFRNSRGVETVSIDKAKQVLSLRKVYVDGRGVEIIGKLESLGFVPCQRIDDVDIPEYPFIITGDCSYELVSNMKKFKNSALIEISTEEILNMKVAESSDAGAVDVSFDKSGDTTVALGVGDWSIIKRGSGLNIILGDKSLFVTPEMLSVLPKMKVETPMNSVDVTLKRGFVNGDFCKLIDTTMKTPLYFIYKGKHVETKNDRIPLFPRLNIQETIDIHAIWGGCLCALQEMDSADISMSNVEFQTNDEINKSLVFLREHGKAWNTEEKRLIDYCTIDAYSLNKVTNVTNKSKIKRGFEDGDFCKYFIGHWEYFIFHKITKILQGVGTQGENEIKYCAMHALWGEDDKDGILHDIEGIGIDPDFVDFQSESEVKASLKFLREHGRIWDGEEKKLYLSAK